MLAKLLKSLATDSSSPGLAACRVPRVGRLEVNQDVEGVRRCDGALIDGDVVLAVQGAPHPRRLVLAPLEVHLLLVILGPVLNCKTEFGSLRPWGRNGTLLDVCSIKTLVEEIFLLVQNLMEKIDDKLYKIHYHFDVHCPIVLCPLM